jgi:hypothetical protein
LSAYRGTIHQTAALEFIAFEAARDGEHGFAIECQAAADGEGLDSVDAWLNADEFDGYESELWANLADYSRDRSTWGVGN